MIFLKTIFFLTSINYIFYSFGFFLLRFFKNDKHKIISIFYGISIIAFLTNILYFFLGLNIQTILIINLVILFLISILNLKDRSFLKLFIKQLKYFLPMFLAGSLIAFFYKEQFFIFRGKRILFKSRKFSKYY